MSLQKPLSHETDESPLTVDVFSGPAWNNFVEYPSLHSNEYLHDVKEAETLIKKISTLTQAIAPNFDIGKLALLDSLAEEALITQLQALSELNEHALVIVKNLKTYLHCELAIDACDEKAQSAQSRAVQLEANLEAAAQPYRLFLERAPEDIFTRYLKHSHTQHEEFTYRRARARRDFLLSDQEEVLLGRMQVNGPVAFSQLYDQISGALKCRVIYTDGSVNEMGLAKAAGLLRHDSEAVRRSAWIAIQEAWKSQEIPCAAILNGLAGWRLEVAKLRSHTRPHDFLDTPLNQNRLEKATLFGMLEAVKGANSVSERAAIAFAKALGKTKLDPWDLVSSAPAQKTSPQSENENRYSYKQGLLLLSEAFTEIHPSFGDFIGSMEKNRWLEGRVMPNKKSGAFCTSFAKSRTPRVYQTYMGSVSDIQTLAHELGHAYHYWVMRDLPLVLQADPMTLAETASTFAETAFAESMLENGTDDERFSVGWQNMVSIITMLSNIPARFEFEKSFYEKRAHGFVSASELSDLTESAWNQWYGETLSLPERQFWMTKLHFSMSELSFYNFPYTFGYLFSLAIYAKKQELGSERFHPFYIDLLRDTGRMTCEELVKKHMNEDISQPAFWARSLNILEKQVTQFESLLESYQTAKPSPK